MFCCHDDLTWKGHFYVLSSLSLEMYSGEGSWSQWQLCLQKFITANDLDYDTVVVRCMPGRHVWLH